MTLPDVSERLPTTVTTIQGKRLQRFLAHVDDRLEHDWSIVVYGSAAVALYLADEQDYEYGYTNDIDIGEMEPEHVDQSKFDTDSVDPPLHFQTFPIESWLVHPDWRGALVDASDIIGTDALQVKLLHPFDLIVSKLARGAPQDIEDGLLLRERYVDRLDEIRERAEEAASYLPPSKSAFRDIEFAFEAIFEERVDLSHLQ